MRRGFVMPMVLLIALAIGAMVAIAMRRQSDATLTVSRQVDAYQEHHGSLGLQAALHVWLSSLNARQVADRLGEYGHALDLELDDGAIISVYLRSGQHTALSDLTGLDELSVADGARLLDELNLSVPEREFRELTRRVGPLAIDANTASEPVIRAAAMAATGDPVLADQIAGEILSRRLTGTTLARADLVQVASLAGLDRDGRTRMTRILTTETRLWYATIEIRRGSVGRRPVARYGGLTLLRQPGGRNPSLEDALQVGSFLTWETLGTGADTDPARTNE